MSVSVSVLKEDLVKYNYLYDSADSVIEYLNSHLSEGNISKGQAEYIYEWSSYILGFRQTIDKVCEFFGEPAKNKIILLDTPEVDISSTGIRERVRRGLSIKFIHFIKIFSFAGNKVFCSF